MATTLCRWLRARAAVCLMLGACGAVSIQTSSLAQVPPPQSRNAANADASPASSTSSAAASAVTSTAARSRPRAGTSAIASATSLDAYTPLAQSASEGVAVLRGPNRQLVTLRVGATLPEARARLVQIQGTRLRFESLDERGDRQTVWMTAGVGGEPAKVERVQLQAAPASAPPAQRLLTAPAKPAQPSPPAQKQPQ